MNRLGLLLTILMLMLASRLPGQFGQPTPQPQQGVPWYGQVVACNDGTISFSVARAHLDPGLISYQWEVAGWYPVDPGKCTEIGNQERYHSSAFGKDPVTLLAFAFYDSTGTWGSVRLSPSDNGLHASNQQFCVRPLDAFGYARDSPGGNLPRVCDGAQSGYQMIPASFEYTGGVTAPGMYDPPDKEELHVKLGPNDRAIPMGQQSSSAGAAQTSNNAPAAIPSGDADASAERAQLLQDVREDLAAYLEASKTGFEAYKNGEGQLADEGDRMWNSSVKPALANGCWVVQGSAGTMKFFCSIPLNPDNGRAFYTQITDDVTASLPADWAADDTPPFTGDLPSKGYRSSSGAHGEVWLVDVDSGKGYELRFELICAPATAQTAKPTEDDPRFSMSLPATKTSGSWPGWATTAFCVVAGLAVLILMAVMFSKNHAKPSPK